MSVKKLFEKSSPLVASSIGSYLFLKFLNFRIGGVRILDGNILDVLEARAISFNRDHIDIYSASWGPDDDGRTVDGPGPLAKKALEDGAKKGRQGKIITTIWVVKFPRVGCKKMLIKNLHTYLLEGNYCTL